MRRVDSDASSAGFSATVHPVARAGASFHSTAEVGPFHGIIAPTTPTGSLRVIDMRLPGREFGRVEPAILVAHPAK